MGTNSREWWTLSLVLCGEEVCKASPRNWLSREFSTCHLQVSPESTHTDSSTWGELGRPSHSRLVSSQIKFQSPDARSVSVCVCACKLLPAKSFPFWPQLISFLQRALQHIQSSLYRNKVSIWVEINNILISKPHILIFPTNTKTQWYIWWIIKPIGPKQTFLQRRHTDG